MSSDTTNEVLDIKVENVKNELDEFKQDIKEEIKEIKTSIKDSEKLFNETIVVMKENNASMRENITWLTTIAGQQREELKLIRESQTNLPNDTSNENVKWYQDNQKMLILFLCMLVLALLGLDVSGVELLK